MNASFQKVALVLYIMAALLSLVVLINDFTKGEGINWLNLFLVLFFSGIAYTTYRRQKHSKN